MPLRRLIWWLGLNIGRQRGNYFGSFGITVYSGLGAESLHPLSPLTATMNWGVIGDDGKVAVRIMYDHRVLDGSQVARTLERLEQTLTNELVAELTALRGAG
jgi:pyruvate/2-oxoglutarate dehydrogenase complex dihydrolipoamide acyltransferase (E2) component